jgi:hypothetical protein
MKTVKLNNGTILEVGEKYRLSGWDEEAHIEILFLGESAMFTITHYQESPSQEHSYSIYDHKWLPHTAPQEEVKWKTFLMVVQHHKSHIPYQVIIRCKSIEDAKIIHKNAISITEVEIDIKEK